MTAAPLLGLGLVLGLRHALEADHLAAVAALATRSASWRDVLRVAAAWGLGHGLIILAVGLAVTALGLRLPPSLYARLDALAGLVLAALGVDVLRRLRLVHTAAHGESPRAGMRRLAMPAPPQSGCPRPASPRGEDKDEGLALTAKADSSPLPSPRRTEERANRQPCGASRRALLVGGLHGLAGSAALVVAVAPEVGSRAGVLAYLALFGMGSILGMGLCSLALSLPLQVGARRIAGLASGLQATIGAGSVVLGLWLAVRPAG